MNSDEYAALYALEERMWWFAGMRRIVTTLLGPRARPGLRCLEAGCGTGYNILDFTNRFGWQVFPFDLSTDALSFSASRGIERLARADATHLPYAAAVFDAITSFDVLTMLPQDRIKIALAEFYRVLRPDGFLLIRLPALEVLRGFHSEVIKEVHRYSLPEFKALLRAAGFRVERATYANSLLFPLVFLKRRVLEPLHLVAFGSDVREVHPLLDRACRAALMLEDRFLAAGGRFPVGVSAYYLATQER
jgi:SAM-dependent methyltransferase